MASNADYQQWMQQYLTQMNAANPEGGGGSGGGSSGGGAGSAIGGLAAALALKYGVKIGAKALGEYLASKGITANAGVDWVAQQLGLKAAETGAQVGAQAATQAGAQAATQAGAQGAASVGAGAGGAAIAGMESLGGGLFSIPAGASVPAGYTAVASGVNGGTLVAANSSILGSQAAVGGGAAATEGGALAGTQAGTTAATGSTASTISAAMPWIAAAVAAYMAYRTRHGMTKQYGTGLTDEEIRTSVPLLGMAYKYAPSFAKKYPILDPVLGGPGFYLDQAIWGGHKNEQQLMRDRVRNGLQDNQFLDDHYNVTLADGSKFDMGPDGGKYKLANEKGGERIYAEGDMTATKYNPFAAVSLLKPLAALMTSGGSEDLGTGMVGYLQNAASSNAKSDADVLNNARAFAAKLGLTHDNFAATIDQYAKDNDLSPEVANLYKGQLALLTRGDAQSAINDYMKAIQTNTANGLYSKQAQEWNGGKGVKA